MRFDTKENIKNNQLTHYGFYCDCRNYENDDGIECAIFHFSQFVKGEEIFAENFEVPETVVSQWSGNETNEQLRNYFFQDCRNLTHFQVKMINLWAKGREFLDEMTDSFNGDLNNTYVIYDETW